MYKMSGADPVGDNETTGADRKDGQAQTLMARTVMEHGQQCHIWICGRGCFGQVLIYGRGRFRRYSHAGTDVIAKKLNQK